MTYNKQPIGGLVALLIGIFSVAAQVGAAPPAKERAPVSFPTPAKVQQAVSQYLDGLAKREETDLLSSGDVTPLFGVLGYLGWDMTKQTRAGIESRLLKDSDWLVRTLRSRKGTRFMRDMSSFPGGYDRLDRMRQNPQGKKELQGLINSPGGAALIEYLTTTKQGRRTGAQLSSPRGGGKFNTPTNRLYTKADVSELIKQLHAAEAAQRLQATSVHTSRSTRSKPARSKSTRSKPSRSLQEQRPPTESTSAPVED